MKTLLRPLLIALLCTPAALFAAAFEGKVNFKMTSEGKAQEIAYSMKGDKVRIDIPSQRGMGGMIMDTTKKETTVIMDEQKMYMTMAMPEANEAAPQKGKREDVKLEKTSETEKILGYTATKYIATADDTTSELWLAEGLGTFMSFSGGGNPMGGGRRGGGQSQQGWERALAGKEMFPLRVVGKNKAGKETFRMEATAINKQSLADTLFAPPAGYQKFDMGGMMKGMMPGLPGRP